MPIIKTSGRPQHNLTDFHYGSLPVEGLPDGPADTLAMLFWDGTQWQFVEVKGLAGVEVNYDAANNILEILRSDLRTDATFGADSIVKNTVIGPATADAVLV